MNRPRIRKKIFQLINFGILNTTRLKYAFSNSTVVVAVVVVVVLAVVVVVAIVVASTRTYFTVLLQAEFVLAPIGYFQVREKEVLTYHSLCLRLW